MTVAALTFREGRAGDLGSVYELGEIAWDESRRARGLLDEVRSGEQVREDWLRDRPAPRQAPEGKVIGEADA